MVHECQNPWSDMVALAIVAHRIYYCERHAIFKGFTSMYEKTFGAALFSIWMRLTHYGPQLVLRRCAIYDVVSDW